MQTEWNAEHFVDAECAANVLSIDRETLICWARRGVVLGHPLAVGKRRVWRFRVSERSTCAGFDVYMQALTDKKQPRVMA
jgi:hypothetical protein